MSMSKDEDTPIQPSVVQNNLDPVVCGILAERNWKYPTEMNAWNMGQDVSKIFDGVWAPNHPNQYPVTPRWNLDMTIFNRNVSQTSWNSIQDL
jgi:hypothetical protein